MELSNEEHEFILGVETAISSAEHEFSKLDREILELPGSSGRKTRFFYNNLVQLFSSRILHLSAPTDSSVIGCCLDNNNSKVFVIDNIDNYCKEKIQNTVEKYKGNNYYRFFNIATDNIDTKKLFKFNIFSYHASIDYNQLYSALPKYIDNMNDTFVVIYNDINWSFVKEAITRSINDLKLSVLFEREIKLTNDESHTPINVAVETWWNGVYIAVLKKNKSGGLVL
jgi:hypothetical protein